MPAVRPGLPGKHHLRSNITAIQPYRGKASAIHVTPLDAHLDMLMHDTLHQMLACSLTTRLADLRRVNAFDTQFTGSATAVWLHPERVTIGDLGDDAKKWRFGVGDARCTDQSQH